ncbi:hypothetical protein G7Y79_00078g099850 [Physcia stellaris]|nr:hypothetical protein G7Y79_00078g099850 [Physcia stellaris]
MSSDSVLSLIPQARNILQLDHWALTPAGALALILLDPFPRNIFRNSADAFASDAKALSIATRAITQALDQAVPLIQQAFFYLPFEHDETLLSQVACVALYQGSVARSQEGSQDKEFADKSAGYALCHRDVIVAFGRFPGRNAVLRRQSTPEELEFLKTHPQGF